MRRSWKRIADWYRKNTPRQLKLAKGASARTLAAFEKKLGILLPKEVRSAYSLHNGTSGMWLLFHGAVLSLKGIERMWSEYNELQRDENYGLGEDYATDMMQNRQIKPVWWNPLRIPLIDGGSGDPVFLDLDPGSGGRRGQIIGYNHETGPERVLAESFPEFLKQIADDLEAGKYEYHEEGCAVILPGMYD